MKLEWRIARSRVARRIVALFVFGALVPLVAVAALSYYQVRGVLIERGYGNLAQLAAAYASSVNERLLAASDQLRAIIGDGVVVRSAKDRDRLSARFTAVDVDRPGGWTLHLLGENRPRLVLTEAEFAQLRAGESVLQSTAAASAAATVTLAIAVDPPHPSAGIIVAELNPSYLWGDTDDLPALTDFLVADQRGDLLFTSLEQPQAALRAMRDASPPSANGRLAFNHLGTERIAQFRELFLQPHFFVKGWTVYASRPEEDLLTPLARFLDIFVPTVGLALFGVALLSLTQVRRTLVPLERLMDGTQRVARREFGTPVVVDTSDEFGELAASFNAMSSRLESQFAVLATLGDIDRAILSRPDIGQVIEAILKRMRKMVPPCAASIALFEHRDSIVATVYTRSADDVPTALAQVPCSAGGVAGLGTIGHGCWLDSGASAPAFARPILDLGATALFTLPITWQETVVAVMVIGVREQGALDEDAKAFARSLADRVGVAFAAAAREEQLYYQAHYDSLTGLPNRLYFKDQLGITLAHAHRGGRPFALLYIDIDYFKAVNDSLGHAAGDDVLRQGSERLRGCVRETDTVARLGGDEFAIILPEVHSTRDPKVVADHVIASMSQPFSTAGQELFVNASIGIALYPDDGSTAEELLRNADTAMYRAKDSGRGRSAYYAEEMNVAALARVHTERDLRHAIERGEFVLHYQPIIDAKSERVGGVEALVRWNHPKRGLLAPLHFINLAEQIGVVDAMGDWVLEEACKQLQAWRKSGTALGRIAVNVSARQFRQPDFADKVAQTLRASGLHPSMLELEITESLLLEATANIEDMIAALKALGVTIALDDFGTGYSSLAYLRRFPVDVVKIDSSFVKDLPVDWSSAAIVHAIVSMSQALNKSVVAEGVATAEQANFLISAGCDRLQGFHFSKPLEPAQVECFLRDRDTDMQAMRRYAR